MVRHRWLVLAALSCVVACSGDTTAPGQATGITFVAGNRQTDTIGAVLPHQLTVRVSVTPTTAGGQPQVIELESSDGAVNVEASGGRYWTPLLDDTTTAGEVSVRVLFGNTVGKKKLIVRALTAGFVDTATFTITPGAVASVQISPADTLVPVQGKVTLSARLFDRGPNLVTDTVATYSVSGPATLSGSTVTVTASGVVDAVARFGAIFSTATIIGMPGGTIAASLDDGTGIVTFHPDGSGMTKIPAPQPGTVRWAPNGQSLVFDQMHDGGTDNGSPFLWSVDLSGHVFVIDSETGGAQADAWPTYSPDGSWIYYVKYGTSPLWRVHPDGTGNSAVSTGGAFAVEFPSVSPDGRHLAFANPADGPTPLIVLDLTTGVATTLVTDNAVAPRWSPAGDRIAVRDFSENMNIVSSDGSSSVQLPGAWGLQYDWSPDGQWLIGRQSDGYLYLVNAASLAMVRLPFSGTFGSPTWR